MRVLIVDDNATNRMVLETILAIAPADYLSVENGLQAVQAFQAERFDLVLMDLQMPVMDGLAATRTIRDIEAKEGRRRTPIYAVTANAMSADVVATREAGADQHIAKPVDVAYLLSLLQDVTVTV